MAQTWRPGDWAVVAARGPGGYLIEGLQALSGAPTRWVHAFTGLADGLILEAEPDGAVIVPFHYPPQDVWWSAGRLPAALVPTAAQRDLIAAAARKRAGTPYSFADYLAIAAHSWHLPAPGLRERVADSGHAICSQLVDQVQLDAGVHLFSDGRWPGFVRPADLARLAGAPGGL